MESPPPDRSKWRYEDDGAPLVTVAAFLHWVEHLPGSLGRGESIFTTLSWPVWRQQALDGTLQGSHYEHDLQSNKVRYPADGMAYVMHAVMHPDQHEPVLFTEPTMIPTRMYTLLLEEGEWRLHQVGAPADPADLGKIPYSW